MFKGHKYITCLTFINEHSQGAIIIKAYYIKTSNYLFDRPSSLPQTHSFPFSFFIGTTICFLFVCFCVCLVSFAQH